MDTGGFGPTEGFPKTSVEALPSLLRAVMVIESDRLGDPGSGGDIDDGEDVGGRTSGARDEARCAT